MPHFPTLRLVGAKPDALSILSRSATLSGIDNSLAKEHMVLLTVEGLKKQYGLKHLFSDVSFGIDDGDKVGIIGANGERKKYSSEDSCGGGNTRQGACDDCQQKEDFLPAAGFALQS